MILTSGCFFLLIFLVIRLWTTRKVRTRAWWIKAGLSLIALGGIGYGLATDLVAQKALGLLMMPVGIAWVLLIVLTIMVWRRGICSLRIIASVTLLMYTLAGNAWLGNALIGSLEKQIPALDIAQMEPFQAVFVLGGGSGFSEVDGPQFGNAGDRIALAARLWLAKKTPLLIASGSSISDLEDPHDLAADTTALWQGLGIPEEAIIRLPQAVITQEEIAAYAQLIRQRGWTRVGLVSSAWHLPRALRLCRRAGIEMVPLGADRMCQALSWSPYWLIPQERGFIRVQRAGWEYLGMLKGR
jgi:uncharacterized SAM-binding protein YcdF (DUF218 family)